MPVVTKDEFRSYLTVFHDTVHEIARRHVPKDWHKFLPMLEHRQARIVGYVWQQFGVAYEYVRDQPHEIVVVEGSERVENLFFTCRADLPGGIRVTGTGTIVDADTDGFFPLRLVGEDSTAMIYNSTFTAPGWTRYVWSAGLYGDNQGSRWTPDEAVNAAIQYSFDSLVAFMQDPQLLRHFVAVQRERRVLLLGDYNAGKERLDRIAHTLEILGYEPTLLKDIPEFAELDLIQKLTLVAGHCRFIVIDDSSPAGQLAEIQTCRANNWVTVILRAHGKGSSYVTAGASVASRVILERPYDPAWPVKDVAEAAQWSEEKIIEVRQNLSRVYPWRDAPERGEEKADELRSKVRALRGDSPDDMEGRS